MIAPKRQVVRGLEPIDLPLPTLARLYGRHNQLADQERGAGTASVDVATVLTDRPGGGDKLIVIQFRHDRACPGRSRL